MTQRHARTRRNRKARSRSSRRSASPKPVDNPDAKIAPKGDHRSHRCDAAADAAGAQAGAKKKAGAQARPDRRSAQEGRRQEVRAEEGGRHKVRRRRSGRRQPQPQPKFDPRRGCGAARQARRRSASRPPATRSATPPALGTRAARRAQLVAERARRVARAARAIVESAGRRAESRGARGHDPNPPEAATGRLTGLPDGHNVRTQPAVHGVRDSALRAVFRGQPFNMLRPETYEAVERHRDHLRSARHGPRADVEFRRRQKRT